MFLYSFRHSVIAGCFAIHGRSDKWINGIDVDMFVTKKDILHRTYDTLSTDKLHSLFKRIHNIHINRKEIASHVLSHALLSGCLLYTSPSPRDGATSRMPSSA